MPLDDRVGSQPREVIVPQRDANESLLPVTDLVGGFPAFRRRDPSGQDIYRQFTVSCGEFGENRDTTRLGEEPVGVDRTGRIDDGPRIRIVSIDAHTIRTLANDKRLYAESLAVMSRRPGPKVDRSRASVGGLRSEAADASERRARFVVALDRYLDGVGVDADSDELRSNVLFRRRERLFSGVESPR